MGPKPSAGGSGKPKSSGHNKTANRTISKKSATSTSAKGGGSGGGAGSSGGPPSKKRPRKSGGGNINGVQITHFEQQRLDRIREKDERKAKKEEKLLLRKKERTMKLKILTKKNRKGQPVMGGRMELLLEKIQKSCAP